MDIEQGTTDGREHPDAALGEREERVAEVARVLSRIVERDPLLLLRRPEDWTHLFRRPLGRFPSVFELADAFEALGLVYYSGRPGGRLSRRDFAMHFPADTACVHTPEDMRREFAQELRVEEAKRRRKVSARRRRDAEKFGLSAEESDRAAERLAELWTDLTFVMSSIASRMGSRRRRPQPGTSAERELVKDERRRREIEEEFRSLTPGTRADYPEYGLTFFYVFGE